MQSEVSTVVAIIVKGGEFVHYAALMDLGFK